MNSSTAGQGAGSRGDPALLWWIASAVLLVLDAAFALAPGDARNQGAGYLIGAIMGGLTVQVVIVLVVYGIARLIGRARTGAGTARLVFLTLAILLLLTLGGLVGRSGSTKVTDAERQGLDVTQGSIRHAAFGFTVPLPSPHYVADPELQQRLDSTFAKTPGMVGWVLRDEQTGQSITIMVTKINRVNESRFREFVTGVRSGFQMSKLLTDSVTWRGNGDGEYQLDVLHPVGVYVSMRCLPSSQASRASIVCVQATTATLHELESVTSGLTIAHN